MKYLKVPHTGQYNSFSTTYVPIDKITQWHNHCIYVGSENHFVKTDWTAEEIEKAIKEAEAEEVSSAFDMCVETLKEKPIEKLYVEGATSKKNADEPQWEMRINGLPVEPQVGEIKEMYRNVTVEVLELSNGELSVGWYRQENTEQIL